MPKIIIINSPSALLIKLCKFYDILPTELKNGGRVGRLTIIRQLYVYIGNKYYDFKKTDLSKEFQQDRTTGLHSFKKIEGLVSCLDPKIIETIEAILLFLNHKTRRKLVYEIKYDNLLKEYFKVKYENKKLNNTILFLIKHTNLAQ